MKNFLSISLIAIGLFIITLNSNAQTFPYTQNFDSWTTSSPGSSCTADGSVTLEDGWTNVTGDNIDWDIYSGPTATANTGPSADYSGSGNYLYTESSSCFGSIGYVLSPEFDIESLSAPELRFYYHMYGATMGSLSLEVSTNGGASWSGDIFLRDGNQTNSWKLAVIDLTDYSSDHFLFRFKGGTGSGETSDMAIDEIYLGERMATPYCSSVYPSPFPAQTEYIYQVKFNQIDNTSGYSSYSDYTLTNKTDVSTGISYILTVNILNTYNIINPGTPVTDYITAWIDWNHDFDFNDVGETFTMGSTVLGYASVTKNITIPTAALIGQTRVRISVSRGSAPTPCNSSGNLYGETEDYSIFVSPSPIYWDGEVDTEWDNPLNWAGDVLPDVSTPVFIPGSAPQFPDFSGALYIGTSFGSNSCKTLTIQSGASVTLIGPGNVNAFDNIIVNEGATLEANNLRVYPFSGGLYINGGSVIINNECHLLQSGNMTAGALYVGGLLDFGSGANWTASAGTVYCLSGSTTEIVNLSPFPSVYLNNLTVQSGGAAFLSGDSEENLFLLGNFTLEPGAEFTIKEPATGSNVSELDVSQFIRIKGDNTAKASFVNQGGSLVAYGTTVVESYYSDNRWHFVSSPVDDAVSGIFQDIFLKSFIESTNSYSDYIVPTNVPLEVGKGYEIWSSIGNPVVQYTGGNLNNGDISPSITATDINNNSSIGTGEGFNFVGNPYPSAIDLGTENDPVAGYTRTNIDNTVYAWNGTGWSSFNRAGDGTGVNGGTRYMPSMQGFFIKANDFSPAFTIPNSARLHSSQANYKAGKDQYPVIRLLASGNGYQDETLIRAMNDATSGFDSEFDGYKLNGLEEVPQLYSMSDNTELSINSLPEFNQDLIIPLGFEPGESGTFTIQCTEINLEDLTIEAILEDLKTGDLVTLEPDKNYQFASDTIDNVNRFNIIFKSTNGIQDVTENDQFRVYAFEKTIYIQNPKGLNSDVFVYDMLGREIYSMKKVSSTNEEIRINKNPGNYVVRIVTDQSAFTNKVFLK